VISFSAIPARMFAADRLQKAQSFRLHLLTRERRDGSIGGKRFLTEALRVVLV